MDEFAQNIQPEMNQNSPNLLPPKKVNFIYIILIFILAVILIGLASFYFLNNSNGQKIKVKSTLSNNIPNEKSLTLSENKMATVSADYDMSKNFIGPVFNADGTEVAYCALNIKTNKFDCFFDNKKLKANEIEDKYGVEPTKIYASPDKLKLMFVFSNSTKSVVEEIGVDNSVNSLGAQYNGNITDIQFSNDSKHFAVLLSSQGYQRGLVVDNDRNKSFNIDQLGLFAFSPDSSKFTYKSGQDTFDIVDMSTNKKQTIDDTLKAGSGCASEIAHFGPNGTYMYVDSENSVDTSTQSCGVCHLIVNGEQVDKYTYIDDINGTAPIFSPDGKKIAFIASNECINFGSKDIGMNESVVTRTNNVETKSKLIYPFTTISNLVFSPDSNNLAYLARYNNNDSIIINDKAYQAEGMVVPFSLAFSPDSKKLSFKYYVDTKDVSHQVIDKIDVATWVINEFPVNTGGSYFLALNGKGSVDYPWTSFTLDGKVVYLGLNVDSKVSVFIDGVSNGRGYDSIMPDFKFSDDGKYISYGALKDNGIYWVKQEIK